MQYLVLCLTLHLSPNILLSGRYVSCPCPVVHFFHFSGPVFTTVNLLTSHSESIRHAPFFFLLTICSYVCYNTCHAIFLIYLCTALSF